MKGKYENMQKNIKIVICEGKRNEQQKYTEWLHKLCEKHNIDLDLTVYDSAAEMLFEAKNTGFSHDLIYLDLYMQGVKGDEAAVKLREMGYINDIIFLTMSKEHFPLPRAFDVKALHYIVKDETNIKDFEKKFLLAVSSKKTNKQKHVVYYSGGETRKILLNRIWYYETYRGVITVYYDKDKMFKFSQQSLIKIEKNLKEYGFFRNYRSNLVSLSKIDSVVYNKIILCNGKELPMSRHKYTELRKLLAFGNARMSV